MKARHQSREAALQILYRTPEAQGLQLASELQKHFDHFQVQQNAREFAAQLVAGVVQNLSDIDATLEKHLAHWKLSRLADVDKSLLRLGAYEIMHVTDTPASVAIDEAIELAKQYGSAETSGFVNGVLDAIRKEKGR